MDKTGEFVQEKNVYSNPLKGQEHLCAFTALGCYLSIYSKHLEGKEKFLSVLVLCFALQHGLLHYKLGRLQRGIMM